ncbi:zinc-binding dehydrogenase [Pseudonocardia spinosispora]|uniref:zinc-binding dehydrogenase n=1 Tax=Pseudonocardia spinosispora TaxID=103441 RepID=UPI001FDFA92C|nr:zinc-binding dehydrogenase [Pseudonocardia spinosispora]
MPTRSALAREYSMFAIRQYEFGAPEVLRYEEHPDPHAGPGQVRIAVRAAGVHLVDTTIRTGIGSGSFAPPELPMTPGREVAGVVDELGDGVAASWLGARVVAHLGPASGGYASLAVRDVASVHLLPETVDFDAGVAMIGTGRTAMGILDAARIEERDVVLVMAAAGGIGSLLVQAGRAAGATVVGLAGGPSKVAVVRELGADIVVDYRRPDWAASVREALDGREVSVVCEGVGGSLGTDAMRLLGVGGRLVMFGWSSGQGVPTQVTVTDLMERGLTATWAIGPGMLRRRSLRSLEEEALASAASGRLRPVVQRFALRDAAEAHRALAGRESTGKVVLVP